LLHAGDIVSVDLGAIVDGWYADSAWTFAVGEVSAPVRRLMKVGEQALAAGIAAARPGARLRDIGAAIQRLVEAQGYSVVRDLCGHGIGRQLHEEPKVPNYVSAGGYVELQVGMALAIEPMVNAGRPAVRLEPDGWTFMTADGTLSVHYEHTVLIQADGPEIITVLR
jgi:methionyl aminopeptidase